MWETTRKDGFMDLFKNWKGGSGNWHAISAESRRNKCTSFTTKYVVHACEVIVCNLI